MLPSSESRTTPPNLGPYTSCYPTTFFYLFSSSFFGLEHNYLCFPSKLSKYPFLLLFTIPRGRLTILMVFFLSSLSSTCPLDGRK
ncbi:hypothetical protein B0H66DRAFT_136371 [Apodospora peruviana]|uniref:Uncharacterized protein n=1 Tax=Apodospora peruviana TaxID=516989 RepID=A0AAE0IIJ9_9PEZI|nr:hypothetical protein B0H66DRAFT_136371 [Apodospora peruviana]